MNSNDAYINFDDNMWTFGTSMIERKVILQEGKFSTLSIFNKLNKKNISGNLSDEFSFGSNSEDNRISGKSGGWKLIKWNSAKLKQGELQLDITLERENIEIKKMYVIYPKTGIIREWASIKNIGSGNVKIIEPSYLDISCNIDDIKSLDFHWMTGAENFDGSWTLRTEKLKSGITRKFDSYDPSQLSNIKLPGDGVNAKILLNDKQVWPSSGWAYTPNASVNVPFDFDLRVEKNDKITFTTNINDNFANDTTAFNPAIVYSDGESHIASNEFGGTQGENGWNYCYIENNQYIDLHYYNQFKQWRKKIDNSTGTPFIGIGNQHPHPEQDAALVWTAPKSGDIKISGGICNTGNGGGPDMNYGYKMNSQTYAPWYALQGKSTNNGLFIGFDYFGHQKSYFNADDSGNISIQFRVGGHNQSIKPNEAIALPKAFTGVFKGDIDDAGNECLNWQYRYMWDYTRSKWFPAVRMLGYWMKGTSWSTGWLGGNADWHSAYQKIFRTVDLMRYTGADVFHRDWGWWDRAGDWNGPDFKTANEYLQKYGMGLLIYAFLYTVDPESKVAKEHPEWLANQVTLDMSIPDTIDFMKNQLAVFREKWGSFEWRNDSNPFSPRDGDDTVLLGQDIGFRRLMKEFLDEHPDCAFQAVNGGGYCSGYDYVRYSSTIQFSDGGAGLLSNYYTSLLFPPDKTNHMPDIWNPNAFDPATFHGLLCANFDMTGDTWDPVKLEGLRNMIDIYHYLQTQGVVGRWVKVYRPIVSGDDPTMYFQRMSRDNSKGIIITKHQIDGDVTIKPKGLIENKEYQLSYQYGSGTNEKHLGSDLMKNGIYLSKVIPGELIYLNIPLHPGNHIDKKSPEEPAKVVKRKGDFMGYPGVYLKWNRSKDDNWISYYAIYRDSILIDKLAKGTFYFDHSAGADPAAEYEVQAVDSAGNTSDRVSASGKESDRMLIADDNDINIKYFGNWNKSLLLPSFKNTIKYSNESGSYLEYTFTGSEIRWFSKLGDVCGKASVSIDGKPAEIIDTYAADDIWNVCVYNRKLSYGNHKIRIDVIADKNVNAKDAFVYVDGFQVK